MSRRGMLGIGLCTALVYAGVDWAENNVEVVTLHASGSEQYYPRLFIVDDDGTPWIRAERPDRLWLSAVRENPQVVVHRAGTDLRYQAEVWNGDGGHEHIDALFRAKYGMLDRAAAWVWRRDAVPIRLAPAN